jgi:hypothetical protein
MNSNIRIREQGAINNSDDLDQQIAEQVDLVRGIQERIATLDDKIQAAKEELRRLLEQKGSNWSDAEGYARIISDGIRTSYETKSLDELIIKDPLHYGWLKDYRKESPVRGGVLVK